MRNIKLRYYLRGLGIGILVTAAILGASIQDETTLTDAQIREKAIELGMVDGNSLVLSDLQGNANDSKQEQLTPETEVAQQESEEVLPSEEQVIEEQMTEEQVSEEQESQEQESEEVVEGLISESQVSGNQITQPQVSGELDAETNTASFVIRSGANSYRVSQVLEEIGLVENALSFDRYLCNNGYSKRIHTGNYMIAIGTSEEEIAKIITGNR